MTTTLSCEIDDSNRQTPSTTETEFEKRRGVSAVIARHGFAQVHISELSGPIMEARLGLLKSIANAGLSLDFLKLTPTGFSFLVPEEKADTVSTVMASSGTTYSVRKGRSIVLVHAVNMRDEEGLIARIVEQAIATGATIEHVGDMHDRLLLVVETTASERLVPDLAQKLVLEAA